MENLKQIIESLLFVAEEPLTIDKIKRITALAEANEVKDALAALSAEYDARAGGFYLDEVAGGFQIRTRPEYNEWIRKLVQPRPVRLSKAALETLVIIAYKQPIIRSDIEYLRGVDCGGVLRVLLERKLIRVLGRREIAGRPLIYATTKHFLEVFDLKNLKDLPTPKEIEELGASLTESEAAEDLKSIDQDEEHLDLPDGPETEPKSSADPEVEIDTPGNQGPPEVSSDSHLAADNTPEDKAAPAVDKRIIHVSPASPDEPKATHAPLAHVDSEPPPENFIKK
jgi:segregation and condensation protein B